MKEINEGKIRKEFEVVNSRFEKLEHEQEKLLLKKIRVQGYSDLVKDVEKSEKLC